jgi:hypothetical protein
MCIEVGESGCQPQILVRRNGSEVANPGPEFTKGYAYGAGGGREITNFEKDLEDA